MSLKTLTRRESPKRELVEQLVDTAESEDTRKTSAGRSMESFASNARSWDI